MHSQRQDNVTLSLFDLTGKRALVTGASRGIGRACAQALHDAGADVVLMARSSGELDAATEAIGPRARSIACDITDITAVRSALEPLPPFDILLNNAGINIRGPYLEVTEADFDTVYAVNVRATFFVAQIVARKMIDAGIAGSIINMSSQMGQRGYANRTVYSSSKHAIEGLTKAMALDLAAKGIRVNAIAPGLIETPMVSGMLANPDFMAAMLKSIPLGRIGQPQDVGYAVLYLSSAAAAHITGACVNIDGGVTAQ